MNFPYEHIIKAQKAFIIVILSLMLNEIKGQMINEPEIKRLTFPPLVPSIIPTAHSNGTTSSLNLSPM